MIEIPLTNDPEQLFSIVLEGATYDVRVILNSRTGIWSIALSQEGVDIITGINLLGGVDIFDQFNLTISNMYVVNLNDSDLDPTDINLGIGAKLFILTNDEVISG